MEEKKAPKEQKSQQGNQRYSYEELNRIAGDLLRQNKEMASRLDAAQKSLESRDFQYSAFYIDSLFKVMEHPEMYSDEFVTFASKSLENSLSALGEAMTVRGEEKKEENEKEDEA